MSSLDTEVVGGTAAEADGDKSTKSEPQALFQATFKLGEVNSRTQKHNRTQSAYGRIRGEDGPGGKRHRRVPNEPTHAHRTRLSAHGKSRYSTRSVSLVHWAVCRRRTARARRAGGVLPCGTFGRDVSFGRRGAHCSHLGRGTFHQYANWAELTIDGRQGFFRC